MCGAADFAANATLTAASEGGDTSQPVQPTLPDSKTMTIATLPRPLDRAEAFFWFLDRFSSMNFAVIAEGRGALDEAALQQALDAAQKRHPLLAVAIEADAGQRLHFVPKPAQGVPLTRDDAADWRTALAERIVEPFALGEAPLVRACRLSDGERWVLALVFHHSIGDARSGFAVLTEVLQGVAGVAVGPEPVSLQPPLGELYPAAFAGDAGRELLGQLKAMRKAAAERSGLPVPQVGHRYSDEQAPRIIALDFTAAEADALARNARATQATVNGLIGAAQLIALRERFGDDDERVLGLTCAADLRPHLAAPVGAETPGFYVTLVTSIQRVGGDSALWPLAQRLTGAIRQQISAGAGHLFYDFMPPVEQFPASPEGVVSFSGMMARGVQTSLLSNAGRLPPLPDLPGLDVESRSFALCPTKTQPVFTAVATHCRGMTINVNYNAAQFSDGDARAVADSMQRLLRLAAA